jgi:alginate O-acetyltransferase complex protein AlgI
VLSCDAQPNRHAPKLKGEFCLVFSSALFLSVFLPATILVYLLLPWHKARNLWLLAVSLFFYAWGEGPFVLVLLGTTLLSWYFGLAIQNSTRNRRLILITGICFALGILAYFKYSTFIVENLNRVSGWHLHSPLPDLAKHLPIGISFFIFQVISYLIDVYRGEVSAESSLVDMAVYKSFFGKLIAGPIVRYADIKEQLASRRVTVDGFNEGICRFGMGMGKKVILANCMGEIADKIFGLPINSLAAGFAWLGAFAYTFQIYFDFSGYSDIAIGLARMFGFRFKENFNEPYLSTSITEFWQRWHISLSSWFRDYVWFPLGSNRHGPLRTYLNLLIVFFLCGLWHGASWTFIVWGLFHGCFLAFERALGARVRFRPPAGVAFIYALLVTVTGWVCFRAPNLAVAAEYWKRMFFPGGALDVQAVRMVAAELLNGYYGFHFFLAVFFCFLMPGIQARLPILRQQPARLSFALLVLALAMIYLSGTTYNPFIYYRF